MMYEVTEELTRRVGYSTENGVALFVPRCPHCGRFVKPDETIFTNGLGQVREPNAMCSKHWRVAMIFEGYFSEDELG